jgi:hypothetical protein
MFGTLRRGCDKAAELWEYGYSRPPADGLSDTGGQVPEPGRLSEALG